MGVVHCSRVLTCLNHHEKWLISGIWADTRRGLALLHFNHYVSQGIALV